MVAGMIAGADSIGDLDVLRHGAMGKVVTGVRAPSPVGTFLRSFTFGHVRQLDAVSSQVLSGLADVVPRLLAGTDAMAFVDIDDTIREVHGYKKQGVAYGYSGVKGLNAQLAALRRRPVHRSSRRPGCGRATRSLARAGQSWSGTPSRPPAGRARVGGRVMVRADSGYYRRYLITAALRAKAWFSITVRMNPAVVRAIAGLAEDAWTTIKYPRAIWDEDEKRWISEAQVVETPFTAFTSARKDQQVPCRLVVRRVPRLNKAATAAGQDELFSGWRHHGFVTNSTLTAIPADETHRDHAIVEQVIAELKSGAMAHAPSGKFDANAAWLALACLAFNILSAAGVAASTRHATARWTTLRTHLVAVPGGVASSARRLMLHLPTNWPWADAWDNLWATATAAPTATS